MGHDIESINKNLKQFNAAIIHKGGKAYLKYGEKEIQVFPSTDTGKKLDEYQLGKIAEKLAEETNKEQNEIIGVLKKSSTKKFRSYEEMEKLAGMAMALFSTGLIVLIFFRMKFTGFVINNISDTTSNIGILVCILGIIGLLFYRFRKQK